MIVCLFSLFVMRTVRVASRRHIGHEMHLFFLKLFFYTLRIFVLTFSPKLVTCKLNYEMHTATCRFSCKVPIKANQF